MLDLLKINGGGDVQPNEIDLIRLLEYIYIIQNGWIKESGTYNWKMKVSS